MRMSCTEVESKVLTMNFISIMNHKMIAHVTHCVQNGITVANRWHAEQTSVPANPRNARYMLA